jgi:hypothetical protein
MFPILQFDSQVERQFSRAFLISWLGWDLTKDRTVFSMRDDFYFYCAGGEL